VVTHRPRPGKPLVHAAFVDGLPGQAIDSEIVRRPHAQTKGVLLALSSADSQVIDIPVYR